MSEGMKLRIVWLKASWGWLKRGLFAPNAGLNRKRRLEIAREYFIEAVRFRTPM